MRKILEQGARIEPTFGVGNELFSGNSKFSGTPMNDPHLYHSAPQYATITRVEEKEG